MTAGNAEKCRACEEAGAKRAINCRDEDLEAVLKDEGVDVSMSPTTRIGGAVCFAFTKIHVPVRREFPQ